GGVGIGADIQLSGKRVTLENDRVADSFRPFAVFQLSMQLDSLLGCEILLLQLELRRQIEEAELLFFFRYHLIEEGQVIAEKQDAGGIVHLSVLANVALEEDRRHRS